jgi:hypothetical protein
MKKSQKEIDDKVVVGQKAVGSDNPGGEDGLFKNRIRVTAEGKPKTKFRGFTMHGDHHER